MDAVALAIAAALFVVGVAAVVVRRWRLGVTALIVGLSLPFTAYADDLGAPANLAFVSVLAAPVLAPLAAWACVRPTALLRAALAAGVVAGPVRTLLYDPFYDPACLTACAPNPLALAHLSGTANSLLWSAAFVVAAALTGAALLGPNRFALAVLAMSSWLVALAPARALEAAIVAGGVVLAIGGAVVARAFEGKARVADLARALESAADVEAALRSAVGDPGIAVAYRLEPDAAFVDRDGLPAPGPALGQVSTDLIGPDGVVARVYHDRSATDLATLAAAITGPARLAFENGRLSARVRRQAVALESSRGRIVAHADSERRRLERDLHDGAQQHVLALGLALRNSLDAASDPETRDVLHRCLASTHLVLAELRDLSHGFYPASLEQSGLGNALDGVVDRAPVAVAVSCVPQERMPAETERAVYLLVSRLAAAARHPLDVAITRSEGTVDVVIVGASPPDGVLGDVFAVLGGTLSSTGATGGNEVPVVRGVLPVLDPSPVEV